MHHRAFRVSAGLSGEVEFAIGRFEVQDQGQTALQAKRKCREVCDHFSIHLILLLLLLPLLLVQLLLMVIGCILFAIFPGCFIYIFCSNLSRCGRGEGESPSRDTRNKHKVLHSLTFIAN